MAPVAFWDCGGGLDRAFHCGIQLRADSFAGERPPCPRNCPGPVHNHGSYFRYAAPAGDQRERIQRFRCPQCGLTISILPVTRLPYRPVSVARLQAFLDSQAGIGSGLDPPPGALEAGCLHRAWARFQTRGRILQDAFGLLGILHFLAQSGKHSLLGDYRCLRLPA